MDAHSSLIRVEGGLLASVLEPALAYAKLLFVECPTNPVNAIHIKISLFAL